MPVFNLAMIVIATAWATEVWESPDTVLAVILTCGTFWGVVTTAATLRDVWLERTALRNRGNEDKVLEVLAWANVRREVIRVLGFVAILILAAAAVMGLSTPLLGRSLLIILIMLLLANALFDRLERGQTAPLLRDAVLRDQRRKE